MDNPTYFASRLSKNQAETTHGYRICLGTPVCRTGPQDYLGSELKRHTDYQDSWGLEDDTVYQVQRPLGEVTSPETIASFEGNTVVDNHPTHAPGSLLTVDNDASLNCGHAQNVRVGDNKVDGETVLLADLHVKEPELLDKIDSRDARDISCGYTYRLRRQADGTLFQSHIRGNHIAVVPQGRAGSSIAIADAASRAQAVRSPLEFFAGVRYSVGMAAYDEHAAAAPSAPPRSALSFFAGKSYAAGKAAFESYQRGRR